MGKDRRICVMVREGIVGYGEGRISGLARMCVCVGGRLGGLLVVKRC